MEALQSEMVLGTHTGKVELEAVQRVTDRCMFSPLSFPQLYMLAADTTKFYKLKYVNAGLKTFSAIPALCDQDFEDTP